MELQMQCLTCAADSYFSQNRKFLSSLTLKYFLLEGETECDGKRLPSYGIRIDSECGGGGTQICESKSVPDLFTDRKKAEQALRRISAGMVRPYCLSDVVYEMI